MGRWRTNKKFPLSFLYIDDCVDATIRLVEKEYPKPINIGSAFLPLTPYGLDRSYFLVMSLPDISMIISASSFIVTSVSDQVFILHFHVRALYHLYAVRVVEPERGINRDELYKKLSNKGIGLSVHYTPLHLLTFYKKTLGYKTGDFPIAEQVSKEVLSLPIYPTITKA